MKQIFSIALLFCICISVFAEDLIITKQGVKISAKIIEVNLTEIRYKKADNLEGPTYTMEKNKINTILYKNGSVGIINIIQAVGICLRFTVMEKPSIAMEILSSLMNIYAWLNNFLQFRLTTMLKDGV